VLATLLLAPAAGAEPSAADRATARSLAREGFEALKVEDFETAEDRFRRADELIHAPTLVVDHARALIGLGRLVEAHERYSLVIREGVEESSPAPWKRALEDAKRELEVIQGRLAWLTVKVSGPDAPEVTLDEKPLPAAALGVRRAVDPGTRIVAAGAEGYTSKEESITLEEGEQLSLSLELEPDGSLTESLPPSSKPNRPEDAGTLGQSRTLTYVAFGIGAVGIITGTVTGILALGRRAELKRECESNGRCAPYLAGHIANYNTLGTVSGIGFGVGLAGAAAGVTLLLTEEPSSGARFQAQLAPNAVLLTGTF
jgi:hypothetical protein